MRRPVHLIIIFLLILSIIGGLFYYQYWQIQKTSAILPIKETKIIIKEKEVPEEDIQSEDLTLKAENLMTETEQLIIKTQEFLEAKESEKLLIEEAVKEAQNRSNDIKSLYMTEFVASSE
ncbi:MAG TPA: hypothetical protein QGH92_01080, partial [Candidatus Parcubacteria bacterium]|nr:hypothetical protein [Candidatus Parcubacteria bacterium]